MEGKIYSPDDKYAKQAKKSIRGFQYFLSKK